MMPICTEWPLWLWLQTVGEWFREEVKEKSEFSDSVYFCYWRETESDNGSQHEGTQRKSLVYSNHQKQRPSNTKLKVGCVCIQWRILHSLGYKFIHPYNLSVRKHFVQTSRLSPGRESAFDNRQQQENNLLGDFRRPGNKNAGWGRRRRH